MPGTVTELSGTGGSSVSITAYNGNLYTLNSVGLSRINVNRTDVNTGINMTGKYLTYNMTQHNGNLYVVSSDAKTLYIYDTVSNNQSSLTFNPAPSFAIGTTNSAGSCVVYPYLYFNTSAGIARVNIQTRSTADVSLNWTTVVTGQRSMVSDNAGNLYTAISNASGNYIYRIPISNPSAIDTGILVPNRSITNFIWGLAIYGGNLYATDENAGIIDRYSLTNPTTNKEQSYATIGLGLCQIVEHQGNLYTVIYNSNPIQRVTLPALPTLPSDITIDDGNTYTVSSGNVQVSIIDGSNRTTNSVLYWYSTDGQANYTQTTTGPLGSASLYPRFYIPNLTFGSKTIFVYARNSAGNSSPVSKTVMVFTKPNNISNCSVSSIGVGNINVSITETSPPTDYYLNNVSYRYYLYTGGSDQSGNGLAYTFGANLTSSSYTTDFVINNLPINNYKVYLIATNSFGNTASTAFSANVIVYTPPINSITIDSGNTKTVAAGNLQVRINDPSNIGVNNVYYQYSVNYDIDASFANTFVKASVSPYTFFIPAITDISNTIYVRASNQFGNTSPSANLQVIVYQTPRTPPQVTFELVQSGNVRVTIVESTATPQIPYYYLNNVSYYLYAYNKTVGGNNLSGNTSASIYNYSAGILSNTDATYENVVSYVNTGLTANTYTMYVIAKNTFGNSTPFSADISVYTTPGNVSLTATTVASGNLQVSIADTTNTSINNVYYLYSTDAGLTFSNSGILAGSGTSPYKLYFTTTDISYTVFVKASNTVGNSATENTQAILYQTPRVPPIFNVSLVSSGNIQITVGESSPSPPNYYYLNNVSYSAYLYTGGTNQSGNLSYYTYNVGTLANTNTVYANVVSYISGLSANTYTVYLAAKNTFGNSTPFSADISVYTTPGNVSLTATTVASGNLQVSIADTTNTSINNVYYLYSTDAGLTFSNSGILAGSGTSPYKLYFTTTDISYTVFVKASNTVGNSATENTQAILYQTPRVPPIFNVSLVSSGNIQITVGESSPSPPNYYYLNNISYSAYVYTGSETNQSGNLSYYAYNVGTLANTNAVYANVVSYITGLSANTYTVYLAAKNDVGNSLPTTTYQSIVVYTIPGYAPIIDVSNTVSISSGNLTVSFTDSLNDPTNSISYYYYLYDPSVEYFLI